MSRSVVFTPEADDQLVELYRYISAAGSTEIAARYTEAIVAYCEELAAFPHRAAVPATTSGQDSARSASGDESLLPSLYWITPWRSSASPASVGYRWTPATWWRLQR